MSKISCLATNCSYNRQNVCQAPSVEVVNCGCDSAQTSNQTACKTFMPYRSCTVDGVVGESYGD